MRFRYRASPGNGEPSPRLPVKQVWLYIKPAQYILLISVSAWLESGFSLLKFGIAYAPVRNKAVLGRN